jgi:hypothetical protein
MKKVYISSFDLWGPGTSVEAGIAIGAGKAVVVLGHRENRLLWHPLVVAAVPGTEELVDVLG